MQEDFLHHIWQFQKYNSTRAFTSAGEAVAIIHPGIKNELSGPDFFNAKIQIGDQLWAGNVEIHIKSSQWYGHRHETDSNYDNVILHVVWEDDAEIYRKDGSAIATLSLEKLVEEDVFLVYRQLLEKKHLKINCEDSFSQFDDFQVKRWLERLYFERLERKSMIISEIFSKTGNNWEASLFILLFRSFGLNLNADAFMEIAQSIDFKIVQKLSGNQFLLEALFLGQAKLIKGNDKYAIELEKEYYYLQHKYTLQNEFLPSPQFFRLRPNNFPTLRLAQLAALYSQRSDLFTELMAVTEMKGFYDIFDLRLSDYWNTHYNFGKSHSLRRKKLSRNFLDLLAINCFIPLQYAYLNYIGKPDTELSLQFISEIALETNSTVSIFNELRPNTAINAMDSQGLLQLKKEYCDKNKCLECELGASLLRKSPNYI